MNGLKLKSWSLKIVFITFAIFLIIASLASLNIIDLTSYNQTILVFVASFVMFIEAGLAQTFKSRGKNTNIMSAFGLIAGAIVLITALWGLFGVIPMALAGIQTFVFAVFVVVFLYHATVV